MDRNQAIGLVLISVMMIVYFTWLSPKQPEQVPQNDQQTTELSSDTTTQTEVDNSGADVSQRILQSDSVVDALTQQKFGLFANSANGTEEITAIENEDIKVNFTSKGANINFVLLKGFKTYEMTPLILLDETSSSVSLLVKHAGREVDLNQLYYQLVKRVKNDSTILTFTASLNSGQTVQQIYTVPPTGFQIGYDIKFNGISQLIDSDEIRLVWNNKLKRHESDITVSRQQSSMNYYLTDGDFEEMGFRSTEYDDETIGTSIKWIAMKQKFFTSAIIAANSFTKGKIFSDVNESDTTVMKTMNAELSISKDMINNGNGNFKYYFGPNNYEIYQTVAEGFSDNLNLGWPPVSLVNKYVIIPLFHFFEKYISSYGIIILILVLVIKLFLSPLSYKSYVSMAKTKVLKPELDALKEKHGGDAKKVQAEQMKLYQQVGVNPLSGCIPMLLQMPILFAMFYFFPNSIELRQQSFLWAHDLSTYDSVLRLPFEIPFYGSHVSLFTLLMTASTILYTWSNNQVSSVQGPMKSFSYIMPVMFMFILNSFSSGLTFYYFVSNIVTFGQQALIRKFVDEDKIKAILEENKKKNANKKTSKFQQRIQDAMKAGKESQQQKKKK